MDPSRWKQIEELYHAVQERAPTERDAVLAQIEPELRGEVESLLAQKSDDGALDRPAWDGLTEFTEATSGAPATHLGPYRIEATIGEGGMGVVLLAVDTRLMRKVALKLLPQERSVNLPSKRRLLQEARAASALNHPNIVVLYDISQHSEVDYLVMEYVPGKTLGDLIPEEGLPISQVAAIGAQVASALAAAHAAGLVHRDIKPANIMVTPDGAAKVLDFGIAKPIDPTDAQTAHALTSPGTIVGTASYMSPEQTRGEKVDGRSDTFSLGAVLYQAATGCLPFTGNSVLGVMDAIANLHPKAPSTLRIGLPMKFDVLIARCLAKLSGDRPAAADLAVELRSLALPDELPATGQSNRLSVAVVPFLLRTASNDDEFLSVALADAVIHRLNSSGKLLVRPTVSVMRYAGKETDWTEVSRDLNVQLVVDGLIQKAGPRLRVLARIYKTGDSHALHSLKFDGDIDDLFGLQDRLSEGVYNALLPSAPSEDKPRDQPAKRVNTPAGKVTTSASSVAYELLLRAAERVTRLNKWDTQSAIEMLTRATTIDPTFTEAWARLAQASVQMGVIFDSDARWFRMAEDAVAKTLALDIGHADALCARGQILWSPHHSYQNRQALRALNGALKLNPGCHLAQVWRGLILFHLGLYTEAEQGLQEALARNPEDMRTLVFLGQTALYRGDYEEAYEFNGRALSADPASVWPNIFYPTSAVYLGHLSDAVEKIRTARAMLPEEPTLLSVEALVAVDEGEFQKAERLADEALTYEQSLLHTHHLWHYAAAVFSMCGKADKAVPLLHRCAEMGLPNYLLFGSDPHFAPIRQDPDFLVLMSKLRVEYDLHRAEFGITPTRVAR